MNKFIFLWIINLYFASVCGQVSEATFFELFLTQYRYIRNIMFNTIGHNSENKENMRKARSLGTPVPNYVPFPCNVTGYRSPVPPNNVHQVRPGDIDVIAAIGDSLTAGNGLAATEILQVTIENRGLAWSIGGQGTWREYITLPNILKEFNPNLFGYSLRDSISTERESQFNVAELGAISSEIPFMTRELVRRMKTDKRVHINKHWKLITIMIGANDFCLDMCYHENMTDFLEKHRNDLIRTLRILRDNLPRTIINLVSPPNLKSLVVTKTSKQQCVLMRHLECFCLFAFRFEHRLNEFYRTMVKWQQLEETIASMPEFQKDDFIVIYQPFTSEITVPKHSNNKADFSNLSQDCFHLSQKFNAEAANGLWNNMMEPVGKKSNHGHRIFKPFLCPSELNPYIFTNINSNI